MAMRYPEAWLDELRSRADILEIVSAYVPLKKNGRNYWGLCPFHGEKTASFAVTPDKQMFYCFGCKAGGSVINFIMDIEHLDFNEAVAFLAERVHMTLPELMDDPDYQKRREQRARLLDANREAARFYHEQLYTEAGKASLDYLKGRGLSDAVIRRFGLGAAPDGRDTLTRYLREMGFTEEELRLAGLSVVMEAEPATEDRPARPRAVRDMFRGRAMFPIIDAYGNVLAFGGRSLDGRQPKYMNTTDTPVFNKRKGVYAANLLRKEKGLERVILVEGYMDVVSLSQFGVRGVCATLGTALTPEQAQLLKRYAPKVYLAYDGDEAGQQAIAKGIDVLGAEGVPCRVLVFPDKLDPDEFIRRDGLEAFENLTPISPAAFRLQRLALSFDLSRPEGRMELARAAGPILAGLDPVEREVLVQRLSVQTGFDRAVLMEQAGESVPQRQTPAPRPAAVRKPRREEAAADPLITAQESLIAILATGQLQKDVIRQEEFDDPVLKSICEALNRGITPAALIEEQETEAGRNRLARIFQIPAGEDLNQLITMAEQCKHTIRLIRVEREIADIQQRLNGLEGEEKREAFARLAALLNEQKTLKNAAR